jgi:hypothetical protein
MASQFSIKAHAITVSLAENSLGFEALFPIDVVEM